MADTDSIAPSATTTKWPGNLTEAHKRACIKYERKSKQGFLMRAYRNMQSRVTGVQSRKHHLYVGKELLPRAEFYAWSLADPDFNRLFDAWLAAGHPRRTCPSIDREDSALGYAFGNIRWITFSENCRNIRRTLPIPGRKRTPAKETA
jgi:hypothetical protein